MIGDLCHRDLGLGVTFSLFHISDEIEKGKAKSITRRKLNSRVWHFFFCCYLLESSFPLLTGCNRDAASAVYLFFEQEF